jgi:hypothetical protein
MMSNSYAWPPLSSRPVGVILAIVVCNVDKGDVRLVESLIVALCTERATSIESLWLEELGRFGILHNLSDLAPDKGSRRLVGLNIRPEVVERFEEN